MTDKPVLSSGCRPQRLRIGNSTFTDKPALSYGSSDETAIAETETGIAETENQTPLNKAQQAFLWFFEEPDGEDEPLTKKVLRTTGAILLLVIMAIIAAAVILTAIALVIFVIFGAVLLIASLLSYKEPKDTSGGSSKFQ